MPAPAIDKTTQPPHRINNYNAWRFIMFGNAQRLHYSINYRHELHTSLINDALKRFRIKIFYKKIYNF